MSTDKMSEEEKKELFNLLYCLIGAGVGVMGGYIGYLFFSRKKPDSELSRAIQLAKRTNECTDLLGQHEEDIVKIRDGLKQCNSDVIANNNEMEQGLSSYQFFQPIPIASKNIQYGRLLNRIDMAYTLTQLLNQYPSISMGTLEDLNSSLNDWEEHHTKVILLVEEYLPETYSCLHESKLSQSSRQLVV